MSWSCHGCANARSRTIPAWKSCKGRRLCKEVDISLLYRGQRSPVDLFIQRHDAIHGGHADAWLSINEGKAPTSFDEFVWRLKDLHGRIFRKGDPEIAGRFRGPGESVIFGNEGRKHERRGVRAEEVTEHLERIFGRLPRASLESRDALTHHLARFIESFFMVHPFVDGNGRVGRMMLAVLTRAHSSWDFDGRKGEQNRKQRSRYLGALEYAHRHLQENQDPMRRIDVRDPLAPLARWINGRLVVKHEDLVETPPPWTRTVGLP